MFARFGDGLRMMRWIVLIPLMSLIYLRAIAALPFNWEQAPWLQMLSYAPPHFVLVLAVLVSLLLVICGKRRLTWSLIGAALAGYLLDGDHALLRNFKPQTALAGEPTRDQGRLRVMALNAQCYTKGFAEVMRAIDEQAPDIVLMSENCKHRHELRETGPYQWPSPEASTTIISRLPILAYHDIDLPSPRISLTRHNRFDGLETLPRRQFAHARVQMGEDEVHLISLRFIAGRAPSHAPWDKLQWGRRLFKYQKQELEFVLDYLEKLKGPVILGGDLNAPPGSMPIKRLTRRLSDANLATSLFGGYTFRNDVLATMRLDYLLYSSDLTALHTDILKVKVSDHYPLISNFQLL